MLSARGAEDAGVAEKQVGRGRIAEFRPRCSLGAVETDGRKHGFSTDAVKGIFKVGHKDPLFFSWNGVIVKEGVGGVNHRLGAALDADADLQRS